MVAKLDIASLEEDHFHKSINQLLEKLDPSSGQYIPSSANNELLNASARLFHANPYR